MERKKENTKQRVVPCDSAINIDSITDLEENQLMKRFYKKQPDLLFKNGEISPRTKGRSKNYAAAYMTDCFKVSTENTALDLLENAAATRSEKDIGQIFSEIRDLDPQSPLESMLASQIVAVNDSIGTLMRNAMFEGQNILGREANVNLATKLQRTFLQQVDVYQKLKGKGQQTVTVKHVTVNEGGQAIVGHVEQKIQGRG